VVISAWLTGSVEKWASKLGIFSSTTHQPWRNELWRAGPNQKTCTGAKTTLRGEALPELLDPRLERRPHEPET
jgi:hypothetical protein